MDAALAVLGFVSVLVLGAALELAIERMLGIDDIELTVRRDRGRRQVR